MIRPNSYKYSLFLVMRNQTNKDSMKKPIKVMITNNGNQ